MNYSALRFILYMPFQIHTNCLHIVRAKPNFEQNIFIQGPSIREYDI